MKLFKSKSEEIKELQTEELLDEGKLDEEKKFGSPATLPDIRKTPPVTLTPLAPHSPPIFIKVEKYRDIIKNIRELKSYLLNLRDAIDILEDIQKEVANGIGVAHKTLDELNMIISNLDSFFLRPQGIEHRTEEEEEEEMPELEKISSGEVGTQVKDVYTQLEKLRAQLKAIS